MFNVSVFTSNDTNNFNYTIDGDCRIIDLKDIISFDIQSESQYIQLYIAGNQDESELLNDKLIKELNTHDNSDNMIYLQLKTTKELHDNKSMAEMYYPELDVSIDMLLLKIHIDGKELNALLDTGAQITILKKSKAIELGIDHLIDTSFSRAIQGVGKSHTVGKIHLYNISIGGDQYPISIEVLDNNDMPEDMIFGLDNMMRLRAIIDIYNKNIRFGDKDPIELYSMTRRPSIQQLSTTSQGKELLDRMQEALGLNETQLEHAFHDVCSGDPRKFQQLFLD